MDQRFSSLYFSTKVTPVPKPSVDRPRYKNKKKVLEVLNPPIPCIDQDEHHRPDPVLECRYAPSRGE